MQVRGSTLALKPKADATRNPKKGISDPTKRMYVLTKFKKEILGTYVISLNCFSLNANKSCKYDLAD